MQADITYIEHSGFLAELPTIAFLFDYYQGEIPKLPGDKPLVVFVSHRHQDHYNPEIFELVKKHPEIYFVLAKGVPVKRQIEKYAALDIDLAGHIVLIKRNVTEELTLQDGRTLTITTFKSTDEGVAFLVNYDGATIYHAGDLNQWVWDGESVPYNEHMRMAYLKEMSKLEHIKVDVAFVPLDPRLEGHAFEGLEVFLEHTKPAAVYPMHFWGDFKIIEAFLKAHPDYQKIIRKLEYAGQTLKEER